MLNLTKTDAPVGNEPSQTPAQHSWCPGVHQTFKLSSGMAYTCFILSVSWTNLRADTPNKKLLTFDCKFQCNFAEYFTKDTMFHIHLYLKMCPKPIRYIHLHYNSNLHIKVQQLTAYHHMWCDQAKWVGTRDINLKIKAKQSR